MSTKKLLIIAIGLLAIVVLVFASGSIQVYLDERRIEQAAAATPQVAEMELALAPGEFSESLPRDLNPATVDAIREREDVVVIDVRRPQEVAQGTVPGSRMIPVELLAGRLNEVPADKTVVFVCRSGNRSDVALEMLEAAGHSAVHHMTGGMRAWQKAGRELQ
jgi:rhodanese-related sulfurtransferase